MVGQTTRLVTAAAFLFGICTAIASAQVEPGRAADQAANDIGQAARNLGQLIQDQISSFAQDPNTAADKLFVLNSSLNNQKQIELGKLAQQRIQSPEVKQISQRLIDDGMRANEQLQRTAEQLNVQLPAYTGETRLASDAPILSALPPDQLERQYVLNAQADRAAQLVRYRGTAQLTHNDAVRQYARAQIPVMSQQYDQLQQVAVALGLPAAAGIEAVPAAARVVPPEAYTPAPRPAAYPSGAVYSPAPVYTPAPPARAADTDIQERKEGGTGGTSNGANDNGRYAR
jgi:predicted outer membrane protein